MKRLWFTILVVLLSAAADAGPLGLGIPQVPGTGGFGSLSSRLTDPLQQDVNAVRDAVGRPRTTRAVENDANGKRIVRGEVLALSPTDKSLAIAKGLQFEIIRQDALDPLGLNVAVLRVPDGMSARDALEALRRADPQGAYDVDHLYDPSAGLGIRAASAEYRTPATQSELRIGMIDGGIDHHHDAFEHSRIVSQEFVAGGAPVATKHGTAVASLLVGADQDVTGALPGATLYAADVYCGRADGGSAFAIAQALAWLASNAVPVVNISLSGPPNAILAAAVGAFLARGHVLVAAVGNDGPAAGIEYPAGYPGVVGATAVDGKHELELEANRGADVAFAAPGVGVEAAGLDDRHETMTGTSFAAPIVAARFALLLPRPDPRTAAQAWTALEHMAVHLGAPGRNADYGYGFLDRPASGPDATAAR